MRCTKFALLYTTIVCDDSDESYWAVLSYGAVYYSVQGGFNFYVCGWNPAAVLSVPTVYNMFQGGSNLSPSVGRYNESFWAVL